MTNETRAAVLAGTINASNVEPTEMHLRQGVALRVILENTYAPLDLEAEVFRYLLARRCEHVSRSRRR
jgi:hypothetical protein